MRRTRSPSLNKSSCTNSAGGTGGLATCDSSKNRADGHAESGEISFAKNITGHDFTGRENVGAVSNCRPLVHPHAEISKRDPRTQWICAEWRCVELLRPIR